MVFRAVEGSILNQGSVSGTDSTPFGVREDTRAVRIFIDNPAAILGTEAEQTVINSTASGTGVTIGGAGAVTVTTAGKDITVSGGLPEDSASSEDLITVSGHLQSEIDSIDIDEVEPAIVGGSNITVTSGSATTTVELDDIVTISSVSGTTAGTFGPAGTEGAGILVNGIFYESALKASDIGGTRRALFQIHRHSTSLPPAIVSSRSNSNTSGHAVVTSGQNLLSIFGTGWSGNHYDVGARMNFRVDGAPSTTSMPGKIEFRTNPPGADDLNPVLVATMYSDQSTDFNGNPITNVGDFNANSGEFVSSLTVSGLPVSLDPDEIEPAIAGSDGITVVSGNSTTEIQGFRGEFISASGSLQGQIENIDSSVTLQEAYDNGAGVVQTSSGKPVVISGTAGEEDFRVVGSGTFTEALTVGNFSTHLNGHSIVTASGIFSNSLTISGVPVNLIAPDVTEAEVVTISGHLQTQIGAIDPDEAEDAIIGDDGITITSGTNTINVAGFRAEFVSASGSLSQEIDDDINTHAANPAAHHGRYSKEENDALLGTGGILVISGSNTITVSGFETEFVSASGSLQTQIDGIDIEFVETALVGAGGITVISGANAVTISGFRDELVSVSGSLQNQVDNLDGVFATDAELTTVSGSLQDQIDNFESGPGVILGAGGNTIISGTNSVTVSGFRSEFVSASGSLQNQIDNIDVDEVEDAITGSDGITVTSGSNTVDIVGFETAFVAASGSLQTQVDDNTSLITTTSGHLQNQIDSIDVDEIENAITGSNGITVVSGSSTTEIQGFRTEFVSASGSLQSQINNIDIDEVEPALIGSDGITVVSGSSTIDIQGFQTEFVSASGSLQTQITSNSDHGNLSGLSDDDHEQYLLVDGSRDMTGNLGLGWNDVNDVITLNAQNVVTSGTFQSTKNTGTVLELNSAVGTGSPTAYTFDLGGGGAAGEGGTVSFQMDDVTSADSNNTMAFDMGTSDVNNPPNTRFVTDFFNFGDYGFKVNYDVSAIGFQVFSENFFVTPRMRLENTTGQGLDIQAGTGGNELEINPDEVDTDLIINGTSANALFVDAGNNRVGIGTNSPVSLLDVNSQLTVSGTGVGVSDNLTVGGDFQSDGFFFPQKTNTEKDTIASPLPGQALFNTTSGTVNVYDGSSWRALNYA